MSFLNKWFCFVILFMTTNVLAQEVQAEHEATKQLFDGFYLGSNLGFQNVFGGAFIDDLEILTQRSRIVLEFSPGYRLQFLENRFSAGFEVQLGFVDGDMEGYDNRYKFDVFYKNSFQSGYGFVAGVAIGKDKNYLIYGYANVTNRTFDIKYTEKNGTVHTKEDGQQFLRYGIGLETEIIKRFSVRAFFGAVDVDFGKHETSQDVEDKLDINIGIVYQF